MKLLPNIKKSRVGEYLVELIIVLLGVWLGMLLSEWSSNERLKRDRKEALHGIKKELEINLRDARRLHETRKSFLRAFDSLRKDLTEEVMAENFFDRPMLERLPDWKGIGDYNPRHSMFDAAKSGNVLIGMDLELLEEISQVYNDQNDIYSIRNLYLEKFLNFDSETKYREAVVLIAQVRQDLWGTQMMMIGEYEETIEMIEEYLK